MQCVLVLLLDLTGGAMLLAIVRDSMAVPLSCACPWQSVPVAEKRVHRVSRAFLHGVTVVDGTLGAIQAAIALDARCDRA